MKYLVMECHPGYAVVLDDEGRFWKVANMGYEVGETVDDVIKACADADAGRHAHRKTLWQDCLSLRPVSVWCS